MLLLTVAAAAGSAGAQSDEEIIQGEKQSIRDTKAQREELDRAAAAATEGLDAATAEAEDLIDALNRAQAAVDAQQAALDEAQRAVADALAVVREAEERIAELEEELLATQEGLREAVIESYVSFQAPSGTFSVLGNDPWQNAHEEALAGFATGSRIDDIDELRRLGEELERWRLLAAEAANDAESHRQQEILILSDLQAAADLEAELSVAAEERVERRLYEVQTLKQIDAQYAAEIEAAEREIAAALARQRAAEEARRRAEEEAAPEGRGGGRAGRPRRRPEQSRCPSRSVSSTDPNLPLCVTVRRHPGELTDRRRETEEPAGGHGRRGFRPGRLRDTGQQPSGRSSFGGTNCGTSEWAVWSDAVQPVAGPQRPGRAAATTRRAWPSTSPTTAGSSPAATPRCSRRYSRIAPPSTASRTSPASPGTGQSTAADPSRPPLQSLWAVTRCGSRWGGASL